VTSRQAPDREVHLEQLLHDPEDPAVGVLVDHQLAGVDLTVEAPAPDLQQAQVTQRNRAAPVP